MNKFTQLLSDNTSKSLQRRATSIATATQINQENLVNNLKQKKCNLELKLDQLSDFGPDTTISLRPGTDDWDSAKWVEEIQNVKQELYWVKIQLKLAEETYSEYFKEGE